jgi:hypothetical protein
MLASSQEVVKEFTMVKNVKNKNIYKQKKWQKKHKNQQQRGL